MEKLIVEVKSMRMGFSHMKKTQIATATEADSISFVNALTETSVEFADEFGLTEHERKQAKNRLARSLR